MLEIKEAYKELKAVCSAFLDVVDARLLACAPTQNPSGGWAPYVKDNVVDSIKALTDGKASLEAIFSWSPDTKSTRGGGLLVEQVPRVKELAEQRMDCNKDDPATFAGLVELGVRLVRIRKKLTATQG